MPGLISYPRAAAPATAHSRYWGARALASVGAAAGARAAAEGILANPEAPPSLGRAARGLLAALPAPVPGRPRGWPADPDPPGSAVPAPALSPAPAALATALPADLRGRVPVAADGTLAGRTVEVRYALDGDGLIARVWLCAGPDAGPGDIRGHARTARAMLAYRGLSGRVRVLLSRLRAWLRGRPALPVGSRPWELQLELEKLPGLIRRECEDLLAGPGAGEEARVARAHAAAFVLGRQLDRCREELDRLLPRIAPGMDARAILERFPGRGSVAGDHSDLSATLKRYPDLGTLPAEFKGLGPLHTYYRDPPGQSETFQLRFRDGMAGGQAETLRVTDHGPPPKIELRPVGQEWAHFRAGATEAWRRAAAGTPAAGSPGALEAIRQMGDADDADRGLVLRWADTLQLLAGRSGSSCETLLGELAGGLGPGYTEHAYTTFRHRLRARILECVQASSGDAAQVAVLREFLGAQPDTGSQGRLFSVWREEDMRRRREEDPAYPLKPLIGLAKRIKDPGSTAAPKPAMSRGRDGDGALEVSGDLKNHGGPPAGDWMVDDKAGADPFDPAQADDYMAVIERYGGIRTADRTYAGLVYVFERRAAADQARKYLEGYPHIYVAHLGEEGEYLWR